MDGSEINTREHKGFTLRRTDPYGFWSVDMKGKIPADLRGSYTTIPALRAQIDNYLDNQKKAEKIRK